MKMEVTDIATNTSGWIQSKSNKVISFESPDPNAFDINDIAIALARQPRFGGHGEFFYSVAQHSVLVATQVRPELRLYGLMHDAHEAYTGDIPGPLKELLGGKITEIEGRLQDAIYEGLGIANNLSKRDKEEIHIADKSLLQPEYRALFNEHIWAVEGVEPAPVAIENLSIDDARDLFLSWYFAIRSRRKSQIRRAENLVR